MTLTAKLLWVGLILFLSDQWLDWIIELPIILRTFFRGFIVASILIAAAGILVLPFYNIFFYYE